MLHKDKKLSSLFAQSATNYVKQKHDKLLKISSDCA